MTEPEEKYMEELEDKCVRGTPDPNFDRHGRRLMTVKDGVRRYAVLEDALVITSELDHLHAFGSQGMHKPVLDLDIPVRLIPSSTEGHFHLYIDKEVTWESYVDLLAVLVDCGLVEEGYVRASIHRGASMVRLPWIGKKK